MVKAVDQGEVWPPLDGMPGKGSGGLCKLKAGGRDPGRGPLTQPRELFHGSVDQSPAAMESLSIFYTLQCTGEGKLKPGRHTARYPFRVYTQGRTIHKSKEEVSVGGRQLPSMSWLQWGHCYSEKKQKESKSSTSKDATNRG